MRNNRDRYGHVYIFLIRKQKLSDLANVRLSVCSSVCLSVYPYAKFVETKTHEQIKIIKFGFLYPPHRGYISFVNTFVTHRNNDLGPYVP